jgi:hypothetical protein
MFRPFLLLPNLLVLPLFSSMIWVSQSHVPVFCTCPFSGPHYLSSFAGVAFNGMWDLYFLSRCFFHLFCVLHFISSWMWNVLSSVFLS